MTSFQKTSIKNKNLCRLMVSTTLAAGLASISLPAHADNWGDHVADIGSISINTDTPDTTNIFQHDDFVKVRGDGDITQNWTVNLNQPGNGSQYVLYDIESDPTIIEGKLNANGQVVIFDKQGTIFRNGSVVKVGSILTSTGHITDSDLQNHKLNIVDAANGGPIIIDGSITVADGGLAAFVAPTVVNNGVISAKMGKVAMASGDKVTLDLYGDNLVEIAVADKVADGLIENTGTIDASGGTVYMGVQTAKQAVDTVINTSGIVKVSSVEVKGGKIILSGGAKGTVNVSGELDASGTSGGAIRVTGQNVVITDAALLLADAGENGNGGTAYIYGTDYAIFNGRLSARGGAFSGNGGNAEISGGESVGFYGLTDLSADNGNNGTLLIDPRELNISNAAFSTNLAFILSGGLGGTVNINDQALANTLRFSNVNLWATEKLNTKSIVDISTWQGLRGNSGTTTNDLTLSAPTVNLSHAIVLGQGKLNVRDLPAGTSVLGFGLINVPAGGIKVGTINLDAPVYVRNGSTLALAGSAQISGDADIVNVKSDNAYIQQGLWLADKLTTANVNVSKGTFRENLVLANSVILTGSDKTIVDGAGLGGTAALVTGNNVTIDNMTFQNFKEGIISNKTKNITLLNNHISSIKGDGIRLSKNTGTVTISGNHITDAGDEGIEVHGSQNDESPVVYINSNVVTDSGDDGIQVDYAKISLEMKKNTVTGSGSDGIEVHNSNNVNIARNILKRNSDQGIDIEGGSNIRIYKNRIANTGNDGIYAVDASNLTIRGNKIRNIEGNGIHIENIDTAKIIGNTITNTENDGIFASNIGFAEISSDSKRSEISQSPDYALIIRKNTITDAGHYNGKKDDAPSATRIASREEKREGDGIDVRNAATSLISTNTVNNAQNDGIIVSGLEDKNDSARSAPNTTMIYNNDVISAGTDGIEIRNMALTTLDINRVIRSEVNGFLAAGGQNGDVVLTGNTFRGNKVGARFESGLIDLTGASNTFINGKIGIQFDPAMIFVGYEELPSEEGGFEKRAFKGRPLIEIYTPAPLSLQGNTIGTTSFNGQSKYYIELLNGALFNPDQPTVINGLNATYDDVSPSAQAGVLSDDQFSAIEQKIYHYTDLKSLGLIVFGLTALPASAAPLDIAQQDIFLTIPGFDFGGGGINLTITGLPQIPGFSVPIASFLANLAPAAGESTPQALASIEPAAGGGASSGATASGTTTTCWGDALSQASQGGSVTMSYDESPASALSDAASCQSGL